MTSPMMNWARPPNLSPPRNCGCEKYTGPPLFPLNTRKSKRKVFVCAVGRSGYEAMSPVRRIGKPAELLSSPNGYPRHFNSTPGAISYFCSTSSVASKSVVGALSKRGTLSPIYITATSISGFFFQSGCPFRRIGNKYRCRAPDFLDTELSLFMQQLLAQG